MLEPSKYRIFITLRILFYVDCKYKENSVNRNVSQYYAISVKVSSDPQVTAETQQDQRDLTVTLTLTTATCTKLIGIVVAQHYNSTSLC